MARLGAGEAQSWLCRAGTGLGTLMPCWPAMCPLPLVHHSRIGLGLKVSLRAILGTTGWHLLPLPLGLVSVPVGPPEPAMPLLPPILALPAAGHPSPWQKGAAQWDKRA